MPVFLTNLKDVIYCQKFHSVPFLSCQFFKGHSQRLKIIELICLGEDGYFVQIGGTNSRPSEPSPIARRRLLKILVSSLTKKRIFSSGLGNIVVLGSLRRIQFPADKTSQHRGVSMFCGSRDLVGVNSYLELFGHSSSRSSYNFNPKHKCSSAAA